MEHLMPIPTSQYIPPYEGAQPLCDMLDREFRRWYDVTIGIEDAKSPYKCNSNFLNVFGDYLQAGITERDTDATKRVKIAIANDRNRLKGMWSAVKPIIDAICFGDSRFVQDIVLHREDMPLADDLDMEAIDERWENIGSIAEHRGNREVFDSDDWYQPRAMTPGYFQIDVDNSTLSYDDIEFLKEQLITQICGYFIVYLGYMDGMNFVQYPNGVMGLPP